MLFLCGLPKKGEKCISRQKASEIVAHELESDWISKNVYPMDVRSVAKKIHNDYETFRNMRKYEASPKQKSKQWSQKAEEFNDNMIKKAYDIRAKSELYQKQLQSLYGVTMTEEDTAFYEDNCHGNYVATSTRTVPKNWLKQKQRKETRQKRFDRKIEEAKK